MRIALDHHRAGRLDAALAMYRQALARQPAAGDVLHLLGVIAAQRGQVAPARLWVVRALRAAPVAGYAATLARIVAEAGKPAAWIAALELDPGLVGAHLALAALHQAARRPGPAAAFYARALSLDPGLWEIHCNLGVALKDLGRLDEAIACYRRGLAVRPDDHELHANLCVALRLAGRAEAAVAAGFDAAALCPNHPAVLTNLGTALFEAGRERDAAIAHGRAVLIDPGHADAWSNLAVAMRDPADHGLALAACHRALRLRPDHAATWSNLAVALMDQGRLAAMETACNRALRLDPGFAEARLNRAFSRLIRGLWGRGWADYEGRWRTATYRRDDRDWDRPAWTGAPLDGRRLLVFAEQGLGDTIQFSRFVAPAAARGGPVVLELPAALARLLGPVPGAAAIVRRGEALPAFDLRCSLMSLPHLLGIAAADQLPPAVRLPPVEPDRAAVWARWLDARPAAVRIGIAWQGTPLRQIDHGRSMPLAGLAPLAALPGVRLVALQKGFGLAQLDDLPAGMGVDRPGPGFDDGPDAFLDTAALMMGLDLIITTDTAIAHLAGTLGRPTWVALKAVPDWRWLLDRDDSPWYPGVRLFRQPAPGDWPAVIRAMVAKLTVSGAAPLYRRTVPPVQL